MTTESVPCLARDTHGFYKKDRARTIRKPEVHGACSDKYEVQRTSKFFGPAVEILPALDPQAGQRQMQLCAQEFGQPKAQSTSEVGQMFMSF